MTETHYYTCDVCTEQFNDACFLLEFAISPPPDNKTRSRIVAADPTDIPDVHVCMSCVRVIAAALKERRVEHRPGGPMRVIPPQRGA